ncbi:MAG: hypothetical protein HEQ10_03410 [Dolichospermum sp. DEX182a]|nr:hypothetical protein [Dolichospermum sp. DEX182a]
MVKRIDNRSQGVRSQESGVRSQEFRSSGVQEEGRRKKEEERRKNQEGVKVSYRLAFLVNFIPHSLA